MLSISLELAGEHLFDFDMGYTTYRTEYDDSKVENEGKEHVIMLSSTVLEAEKKYVESVNSRFDSVTYNDILKYDYDLVTEGYSTETSGIVAAGINYFDGKSGIEYYYLGYPSNSEATYSENTTFYTLLNPKPNSDMLVVVCGPEY